jgi:hypothetical protein
VVLWTVARFVTFAVYIRPNLPTMDHTDYRSSTCYAHRKSSPDNPRGCHPCDAG